LLITNNATKRTDRKYTILSIKLEVQRAIRGKMRKWGENIEFIKE
jgi:hypothetical protein